MSVKVDGHGKIRGARNSFIASDTASLTIQIDVTNNQEALKGLMELSKKGRFRVFISA